MPIEHINKTDTLNEGREKLNAAIDGANAADVTSKEADTKATQALANSESTQTQLDTIVIDGDSSVEAAQARVDEKGVPHPTLKARIDDGMNSVNQQLADTVEQTMVSRRALNYYWIPEQQPPARNDRDGHFIDAYRLQSDEVINDFFEPMRLENTDYITRENMGKDQSGQYDIWRYHYTLKNYTKTIIINTCIHGGEVTTLVAMLRFLHYLINEWENYPVLADIRENVRIIYIPFANPWGVNHPVGQRTRHNSRGVNLNRNFPYRWEEFNSDEPFEMNYKGEAPFSEIETQYIRDTLEEFSDAIAYFDMHNTGAPLYDYYVPVPENSRYKTYEKLLAYFTKDLTDPNIQYRHSTNPTAPNFAFETFNIPSSGPEWCDGVSGTMFYSVEITKAL